jgi:hypothetical protein
MVVEKVKNPRNVSHEQLEARCYTDAAQALRESIKW